MYSVKGYKQHKTYDGIAYVCSLYRGTKKVAFVQNDGDGGATFVRWDARDEAAEFLTWARANITEHALQEFDGPDGIDEEAAVEALIAWMEFDKIAKKGAALRMPSTDSLPDVRELKSTAPKPALYAAIAQQYPQADVWDTVEHRWVPAALAATTLA